jgi:hypothetical protein
MSPQEARQKKKPHQSPSWTDYNYPDVSQPFHMFPELTSRPENPYLLL